MLPDQKQVDQPQALSRQDFIGILSSLGVGAGAVSLTLNSTFAAKPGQLDTPALITTQSNRSSIELQVTAGASGAPGGFVIQWVRFSDYMSNNGQWPHASDKRVETATFSGEPATSRYSLSPNQSINVKIGDLLFDAGVSSTHVYALSSQGEFLFRVFALGTNRLAQSDPSSPVVASLLLANPDCPSTGNCVRNLAYWKQNGPGKCNAGSSVNLWPLASLSLGSKTYDAPALCDLLQRASDEFGLNSMAQQLVTAKLNVAANADAAVIAASIEAADLLIGNQTLPALGKNGFPTPQTFALVIALTNYNEGCTGPSSCC